MGVHHFLHEEPKMYLNQFVDYLKNDLKKASNTVEAYERDVKEFTSFVAERGVSDVKDVQNTEVVAYLLELKNAGKSAATVNRKLASIRSFYRFLMEKGVVSEDPTNNIKSPRIPRKKLQYLSIEEIDQLLAAPDDSRRGKRDRAILELLYATGIRVTELIEANVDDINLRMGFITCAGEQSKARIIPMGRPARVAMEEYIYDVRDKLLRDNKKDKALFLNYYGQRITRQGLWKILKAYGEKAGLEHRLTPNIIRNSFAVHMIQNGADLKSLQELLGHEDITATQIYLTVTENRIKDVYDKTHPRAR